MTTTVERGHWICQESETLSSALGVLAVLYVIWEMCTNIAYTVIRERDGQTFVDGIFDAEKGTESRHAEILKVQRVCP